MTGLPLHLAAIIIREIFHQACLRSVLDALCWIGSKKSNGQRVALFIFTIDDSGSGKLPPVRDKANGLFVEESLGLQCYRNYRGDLTQIQLDRETPRCCCGTPGGI